MPAIACAKKILEHAEVPLRAYMVVTDLGIEKTHDTVLSTDEIQRVKAAVKEACNGQVMTAGVDAAASSSSCG